MRTAMRLATRALPWGLAAAQAVLVNRLIARHGKVLLEQDRLADQLAREKRVVAELAAHGAGSRGVARTAPPRAANDPSIPSPLPDEDNVHASPYAHYHRKQDAAIRAVPPYPSERFDGAGIVMLAGGPRLFTNAWVGLTLLRQVLGCRLPIQVWYLGPGEMSPRMLALLQRFDVECVDALAVQRQHPARVESGWEFKPYAVLHSRFHEVIFLDADTMPLIDPATLLSTPEYRETGAIFWPDRHSIEPERPIWDICRVPYRDEPEFETGQMVIDKERCWKALHLTLHMNEHSAFYYQHVHGDKETFHMAWRMLDQPYSMPPYRPKWAVGPIDARDPELADVMQQHDFEGRIIFHHRTGAKWNAWGENFAVEGFEHEATCQAALRELRQLWDGRVDLTPVLASVPAPEAELLRTRFFLYRRIGADERVLELLPGHRVGEGRKWCERQWRLEQDEPGRPTLLIIGRAGVTCRLQRDADGVWRGRWQFQERMPVELYPLGNGSPDRPATGNVRASDVPVRADPGT